MNKYRNKKAQSCDGKWFASMAERDRYEELRLLERGKKIFALACQPVYQIEVHGVKICKYIADFTYRCESMPIVEDVKSAPTITPLSRLKMKMFRVCYPKHQLRIMKRSGRGFVESTGTRRKATARRRSKSSKTT